MTYSNFDHIQEYNLRFTGSEDTIRVNPSDPIRAAEYNQFFSNNLNSTSNGKTGNPLTSASGVRAKIADINELAVRPVLEKLEELIQEQALKGKLSLWLPQRPFNSWQGNPWSCNGLEAHVTKALKDAGYVVVPGRYNDKPALCIQWDKNHCNRLKRCYY